MAETVTGTADVVDVVDVVDVAAELDGLLARDAVVPLFQPLVDLGSREVVAFEALARGPADSPLRMPDQLFGTARRLGRLVELDESCQRRALEAASTGGLRGPIGLFVNVEPAGAADLTLPGEQLLVLRERKVRPVLELTERALIDDPAGLLAFAARARSAGWSIALDDVGANSDSLTLMPLLRPEFVKLDLRLVQRRPDTAVAEIMTAVTAYAESSGTYVIGEGIETEEHEYTARSLGATLGQGWRYGRPAPLPEAGAVPEPRRALVPRVTGGRRPERSPFRAITRSRAPLRGSKSLLIAVSRLLENQASQFGGQVVVLAALENSRWFTPATARHYTALAARAALVVVLGAGMPARPAPGVRGADLLDDDPLLEEWAVVVLSPHFASALVARDLGDHGPDLDRTFDYTLTYDRDAVLDAARSIMGRALPVGGTDGEHLGAGLPAVTSPS